MDIDIDQFVSLVNHAVDTTVIDSAFIPISCTHKRLTKRNLLLAPRLIYAKSIDFAYDHIRGIIENGQTDVENIFMNDVDGQPWVWSILPELRLNTILDKVRPLTSSLAANGKENVSAMANGVIAALLAEFGYSSINDESADSITRINNALDGLYSILAAPETDLTKSMQSALFAVVCSIPLGEYGLLFSIASLFQIVWRRILEYKPHIHNRKRVQSHYMRIVSTSGGMASGSQMNSIAYKLMEAAATSKNFISAVLLQIWLGTATLDDHILDSTATINKFNLIGSAVCDFIKAPTRVESLLSLFDKTDVLDLDLDLSKFGEIITALQINNMDITSIVSSVMKTKKTNQPESIMH